MMMMMMIMMTVKKTHLPLVLIDFFLFLAKAAVTTKRPICTKTVVRFAVHSMYSSATIICIINDVVSSSSTLHLLQ